jgi:hypothetical protein
MFQTKVVEEIKTHFVLVTFFENCVVYEIMRKNIVERGRPQMTIWRMRIECRITKATHTHTRARAHSQYVIHIAFPLQQWLQECALLR